MAPGAAEAVEAAEGTPAPACWACFIAAGAREAWAERGISAELGTGTPSRSVCLVCKKVVL